MKIIALTGKKGSGKTTVVAKYLVDKYEYARVGFSDPIKLMEMSFLEYQGCPQDLAYEMVYGNRKETASDYLSRCSSRYFNQTIGTEWGRNIMHQKFWTNAWKNHIAWKGYDKIVVDDLRFESETNIVRRNNGIIVRVSRLAENDDKHISETELDNIQHDFLIENDRTIEETWEQIDHMMIVLRYN